MKAVFTFVLKACLSNPGLAAMNSGVITGLLGSRFGFFSSVHSLFPLRPNIMIRISTPKMPPITQSSAVEFMLPPEPCEEECEDDECDDECDDEECDELLPPPPPARGNE